MIARRLIPLSLLVLLIAGAVPEPVAAQFTPRFSTTRRASEGQVHIGIGSTVANIGDYTSAAWPEFEAPVPILYARLGYTIPVSGETWFVLTEIEVSTAASSGEWRETTSLETHTVEEMSQTGVALLASGLYATEGRKMLLGAGFGFYLMNHDPALPRKMLDQGLRFLRDPFLHMGFGAQLHVARSIAEVSETTDLMLEARYRVASLAGNVPRSLRSILMSEFQLGLYLAIK